MRNLFFRYIVPTIKYLLISLALLYAADWSAFEIRLARGTALGSVPVEQYMMTPLKGYKVEYDYLGKVNENCSMTAFPQYAASAWNPPCWWLKRHNQNWQ
ncbi:MAG: hypothetical protein CXZ00_01125 [Acidobacteria bacterium]|nr:MAG: hypothetical protein CXZ00_01125 [Acidobacteriota bacterium]